MKVALIGNMNNNFFAMMRYFVNAGIDAHVFITPKAERLFDPSFDTIEIQKWESRIHHLNFKARYRDICFHHKIKKQLQNIREEFDIIIGEGLLPALFYKLGLKLDIFIPYADTIEGLSPLKYSSLRYFFRNYLIKKTQLAGILKITHTIIHNSTSEFMETAFKLNKLKSTYMSMPAVYIEQRSPHIAPPIFYEVLQKVESSDYILFSQGRQLWKNLNSYWEKKSGGKRNDIVIRAFADLCNLHPETKCTLILCEYGIDVDASKELIHKLNISNNCIWLPPQKRIDLLQIIPLCHLVLGQFGCSFWGSSGWEAMGMGRVLINKFDTIAEFKEKFGCDTPIVLPANTQADILTHLKKYIHNPELALQEGERNKQWFKKYYIEKTIKDYINLFKSISAEKA